MSDDFYRPTLTFPSGAYNATQVRLYGIRPNENNSKIIYPGRKEPVKIQLGDLEVSLSVSPDTSDPKNELINQLFEGIDRKATEADQFARIVEKFPDEVKKAKIAYLTNISIATKQMGNVAISTTITAKHAVAANRVVTCGIIVGYAYEGHTYDLPKPKIMIIPTAPEPQIPVDDSGYDKKEPENYAVWLVDKLDECLEFEMNQGFVEQLILDANTPGKRAPNMYAWKMMTGHRGGKLTE
jgi:hypothetical protein